MTWRTTVHAPWDEIRTHDSEEAAVEWAARFHADTGESVAIWEDGEGVTTTRGNE